MLVVIEGPAAPYPLIRSLDNGSPLGTALTHSTTLTEETDGYMYSIGVIASQRVRSGGSIKAHTWIEPSSWSQTRALDMVHTYPI